MEEPFEAIFENLPGLRKKRCIALHSYHTQDANVLVVLYRVGDAKTLPFDMGCDEAPFLDSVSAPVSGLTTVYLARGRCGCAISSYDTGK